MPSTPKTGYVTSGVCLPKCLLTKDQQSYIRSIFVLKDKRMDMGIGFKKTFTVRDIVEYSEDEDYFFIPRDAGISLASRWHIPLDDETSQGVAISRHFKPISLYDYQEPLIEDLLALFQEHYDVRFQMDVGLGKSFVALELARRLGRTVLVIVNMDVILKQWVSYAQDEKATQVLDHRVGIVQGKGNIDYKRKSIVVASVKTLLKEEYFTQDFYDYFGLVIYDEAHTSATADSYSKTLWHFNARYRLFLSATFGYREDVFAKVLNNHAGPVRLVSEKKPITPHVRVINNSSKYSDFANKQQSADPILREMKEDSRRNELLCRAVLALLEEGHCILVLGDRVSHLSHFRDMLLLSGLDPDLLGFHCGENISYDVSHRGHVCAQKKKQHPDFLKSIRENEGIRVILATYAIFSMAVSVNRLSAGVELSPKKRAKQVIGRVLREEHPLGNVWVTTRDFQNTKLEKWYNNRLDEYKSYHAEFYRWQVKKKPEKVNLETLQRKL